MAKRSLNGIAGNGIVRRGLFGLVAAVLAVAIASSALDIRNQLQRLATASSDNVHWVLTQAETEIISLENAALNVAENGGANLGDVRLRFDIFYSRVETLKSGGVFADLRENENVAINISDMQDFLDRWVPLIDGPENALVTELNQLAFEASEVRARVRDTALTGIDYFSYLSDQRRESISQTLFRIGILTLSLIALLILSVIALGRMATVLRREAKENRENRDRMETIISTSLDAILVTNKMGQILEYNGAAERIFGYPRNFALGSDMAQLIIPDHFRPMHNAGMERFRKTGEAKVIGKGIVQLEAQRSSGEVFPIDLSLARAQSREGEIFVGFVRDISARVNTEDELREARDKAIEGEKSKAELLAVMSHEMRTPLNGMLGTLELFDQDDLSQRHKRYLRIIRNSGQVLLHHVNDVLDISRLDAGKMSMSKTHFDLIALLGEIIEEQTGRAREHGNTIIFNPPNPVLHEVWSDPSRLRQIILNLLGNAIKFTRNGQITIEIDCENGLENVEVRVIDNGVGIAEKDLSRIFGDFVTIDTSYGRSNSGTGLGLGISRRLATALGGELGAESEEGDGSVFWLRIPLMPPTEAQKNSTQPSAPATIPLENTAPPLKILMVEDNAINRMVAREMLERQGHHVSEAHDGVEGVAMATAQHFDVVLMDISMPEMDGMQATRAIRNSNTDMADVPIIATTAHALPQELEAFKEAGMNDALIKPLSIASVAKALSRVIAERADNLPEHLSVSDTESRLDGNSSDALIDWIHLAELTEDLPDSQFRKALTTLATEMTDFVDKMPSRITSDTGRKTLGSEAHRMAGSAGVFGATQLTQLMRALQTDAQDASETELHNQKARIETCWLQTRAELAENDLLSLADLERQSGQSVD